MMEELSEEDKEVAKISFKCIRIYAHHEFRRGERFSPFIMENI